jgi:hypothetical protein
MRIHRRWLAAVAVAAGFSAGAAHAESPDTQELLLRTPAPHLSPLDRARAGEPAVKGKPARLAPLASGRSTIVPFSNSPFPYEGMIPKKETPFLDVSEGGRRGHTSVRAGVYWEDETYSDRSVLLAFPKGFDLRRPAVMVVFLHGNNALLARDVVARQQVVDQVEASGLNAVLVAPQFAHDAQDSSAGNFWRPDFFARFLKEAAARLARFYGAPASAAEFERMPVVLVAYSGGYNPAAYALAVGGAGRRVHGVVLLDALYGEEDKFIDWIGEARRSAFFLSAYSLSSADGNGDVEVELKAGHFVVHDAAPNRLTPGTVTFIAATDPAIVHDDFMTTAWVPQPLAWVLARIPGYPR